MVTVLNDYTTVIQGGKLLEGEAIGRENGEGGEREREREIPILTKTL